MPAAIILVIIGLAVLIAGAESLVRGAASLARRLGISPLAVGLTVVAIGTSMPELVVNLFAGLKGSPDLAIGNVIGSNIANILLIMGIASLIAPLTVAKGTVWREIPFALLAIVLVIIMGNDRLVDGLTVDAVTRTEGLTLMSIFVIFLFYVFAISRNQPEIKASGPNKIYSTAASTGLVLLGMGALYLGGKLLVEGAIDLARLADWSEALIGLTIVAVGTSLPELATSVVAVRRGQTDIAVGNVVGSNIFNVFWVLGLTSVILPLPFNQAINVDVLVGILASLLLFSVMFVGRRHTLERWQGGLFLGMYAAYVAYLVARG